jgi:hypothetical protein
MATAAGIIAAPLHRLPVFEETIQQTSISVFTIEAFINAGKKQ